MSESPLVYVLFGIANSERRAVIYDLIDGGVEADKQVLFFRPAGEAPSLFDEKLATKANISVVEWTLKDSKVAHGQITAAPEKIIFLAPGDGDPADVCEAVKNWSSHNNCPIARLLTVVNCSFLKEKPGAQAWFDACIHFSDIVLLARREGVDNKWVKTFEERYTKSYFPCHFSLVKKGRVRNPPEILFPEARRYSLYFDELIPIEEDEFEDERPEDQEPDQYMLRLENGQRAKPIPSITKWL
ncbi:MAG: hypothetical protein HRT56_02050 [Coraliomargarita sp.]|nr:hypothetical protein [Coraliomargarita sp.]